MSINAMPTKSYAVPPQRDRDTHSRSDSGSQSQNTPLPAGRYDISAVAGDLGRTTLHAPVVTEYAA